MNPFAILLGVIRCWLKGSTQLTIYIWWHLCWPERLTNSCYIYIYIYLTNRFHVAVRLFSNRSQMTSKCGKNKKVGTEDVKVTAINMYKYKERLRLYKRWPCSTYILNRINWRECSVTWSARFLSHMNHVSVSPTGQFCLKYKCYTANVCINVTFPCLW